MAKLLAAFACGLLFGAGLVVSEMTDPEKVIGFLDVFGAWDASLAFVMIGAIGVHAPLNRLIRKRSAPPLAPTFSLPESRAIDARLLLGAAVFGLGWGMSGYCPGPALVALPSLGPSVLVFVLAMAAGMLASALLEARLSARRSLPPTASEPS